MFAITVGRGVPQSNFSRRKITLRYAAILVILTSRRNMLDYRMET